MAQVSPADCPPPVAYRTVFQPLVELHNREIFGYEALSRFDDHRSPLAHLEEARKCGILTDLELALIESAVADSAAVSPRGLVTVNASAETITDRRLAHILAQVPRRWGVELSERSLLGDGLNVRSHLDALDALFLVDDAGAHHSTVERVRELRPDIVKVDRKVFWRGYDTGDEDATVERLLEVSREVDAKSLVEGIETLSHERFAKERGATLGQGFLYGAPTPGPAIPGKKYERKDEKDG